MMKTWGESPLSSMIQKTGAPFGNAGLRMGGRSDSKVATPYSAAAASAWSWHESQSLLTLLQTKEQPFDGSGIPSLVHHGIDVNRFSQYAVVNEKRKYPGNHAMKTKKLAVVSVMKEQRLDVRAERVQEIVANARLLSLVEKVAVEEILFGMSEDLDCHAVRFLNSFLTWFQSS
jgi:hypothetical protein